MFQKAPPTEAFRVAAAFWAAALFWGTSFLWIKLGLKDWNPVALVAYRLAIASVFFAVALYFTNTRIKVKYKDVRLILLIALLNPYVPFLLITWAEKSIETGVASILNATVPLFTLVIAGLFLPQEKPTWRTVWGTLVGFIGVAILFSDQGLQTQGVVIGGLSGKLAVLLAALCYSVGGVILRRNTPEISPFFLAALMNAVACVYVWVHGFFTGQLAQPPSLINWLAVLWLGAFGSFAAYSCAMYVMVKRGAMQTALINFAYPLLGLFLGIVFLGEPFQWKLIAGAVLILGGILAVQKRGN